MKKLLVSVAVAGLVGTASAQSAFEGFFGQVGVGYESATTSFTGGTVSGTGYSVSANNSNSFAGTVAIGGYFPVSGSFLLGVGAEYSPIPGSSANYTITVPAASPSSYSGTWKKKDSYNLFVSPAIAIDKTKLAYAKVGFTGANIDSTYAGSTETTGYTGYSLGLGYKQVIEGGLYGFGEVNYAAYSSKNDGGGFSGSNKPTATNIIVGVGYRF